MSEFVSVEIQNLPMRTGSTSTWGRGESLHLVVVLRKRVDGYRAYKGAAYFNLNTWEEDKKYAIEFVSLHGNKVSEKEARCYFLGIPKEAVWAK